MVGTAYIYEYLKENHLGIKNGINRSELADILGVTQRELRRATSEINANPQFEKLVSTTHNCFMCETESECEKSIKNTYRVAITLLKKAKQMERKVGLNGQIKIGLGEDLTDIVRTFE